jgi:hypothetical protein
MNQIDLPFTGHDPDHDELLGAARFLASQIGSSIQPVDHDAGAMLLVHRDAEPSARAHYQARGAVSVGGGHLFEVIDGERLTAFGLPSSVGGLRFVIITKLSCRMVELRISDTAAEATGAALLGGRK